MRYSPHWRVNQQKYPEKPRNNNQVTALLTPLKEPNNHHAEGTEKPGQRDETNVSSPPARHNPKKPSGSP